MGRSGAIAASVLGSVMLFTNGVGAATVNLLRSSMNGFVAGTDWSDGGIPGTGNDYVVANGYYLHGDYSQTFNGDSLQIGIVGGTYGYLFKEHVGTHTFKKLILANGYYRTWMSNVREAGRIAGAVEVTSPASAPFVITSTHDGGGFGHCYLTYWDADFTGAIGTGVKVGPMPPVGEAGGALPACSETYFTGDNSGYLGVIEAYGSNTIFGISSDTALGGALPTMTYDAFKFRDHTIFRCAAANVTLAGNLNRGIEMTELGGRFDVPSGNSLTVAWPVSGTGPLTKTGAGTLTLAGALDSAGAAVATVPVEVEAGTLVLADGFSNAAANTITVRTGGALSVKPGDEVTVRALSFDGGAFRIAHDETTGESGVLVLTDAAALAQPIPVYPQATRGVKVPFLKVPTSVGTITAASFAKPADLAASGLPTAKFTVETADGVQTAYAEALSLVYIVDNSNRAYLRYGSDAWMWSDGQIPHAGADYEVGGGKTLYSTGVDDTDETLKPDTLSFRGKSNARSCLGGESSPFRVKGLTGDIRTYDYVKFFLRSAIDGDGEMHLRGRLYVGNSQSSDNGLDFRTPTSVTVKVDSVVSGSGIMSFQPTSTNRPCTFHFTADNRAFTGNYFVYATQAGSWVTLKFDGPECLGADRPTLTQRSVLFQGLAELYPVGSQVFEFPNREFSFITGGTGQRVRVDADETFELRAPVEFRSGSVTSKVGGGTWAVGGSVRVSESGSTPVLNVSEGFVRADNARAFAGVVLSFAQGAGIVARCRPGATDEAATYGMIVTDAEKFSFTNGVASADAKLLVRVDTHGWQTPSTGVPFLTVPAAMTEALDGKIEIRHDAGNKTPLILKDEVTIDDRQFVRYSCRFANGFLLIVR